MSTLPRLAVPLIIFATCLMAQMLSAPGADTSKHQVKLNGGYYLLHKLGDDESQLPILFDFKHSPQEIRDFADQLSKLGKKTDADIEQMHERDSALRYDNNPLPDIEQETRDSISDDKAKQLLLGAKGDEFVRVFLVSQIEASTYGLNLSKIIAKEESDPNRARKLENLSAQWLALRDKAQQFLRDY